MRLLFTFVLAALLAGAADGPRLVTHGTARQLQVDGRPFLIIGGELHNSSSSDLRYMAPIWPRLVELNFNTVLAGLSWELVEPEEGRFDFALVDGLIQEARRHDLRLVFLWFGSWKNGMSSYVPAWVKSDYKRFPRVRLGSGETVEVLSTLSDANWKADADAFAAVMRHIRQVDGEDHTVLMMQVENEVGVLGDSRDRSETANDAFTGPIPRELSAYLAQHRNDLVPELEARWNTAGAKTSGSWETVFGAGPETDELFMAWNYARYCDHVAAAGKAAYDIPMYFNAWLSGASGKPGSWPSGGPLPHVMDMWLANATHIDMLSPDIYQRNFEEWCGRYTRRGNTLFIPEMMRDAAGARNVFAAIGQFDAIGTSPFAVDSMPETRTSPLGTSYAVLRQLAPLILEHQGKSEVTGFVLSKETPAVTRELGGYRLEISLDSIFGMNADTGYGIVIATGKGEFVGAGSGFRVAFQPLTPGPALVGIAAVDEGTYRDGKWIRGRRLNGDENDQGKRWRFAPRGISIERCTVYRYE